MSGGKKEGRFGWVENFGGKERKVGVMAREEEGEDEKN